MLGRTWCMSLKKRKNDVCLQKKTGHLSTGNFTLYEQIPRNEPVSRGKLEGDRIALGTTALQMSEISREGKIF